jgi:hypothetical protein
MTKKTWYIAGIIAAVLLGWFAQIGYFVVYGPRYPINVQLSAADCALLAHGRSKDSPPAPCRFTASIFHSDGGWVGYGVSDNVKGQCLWLAFDALDASSFDIASDLAPMATLPKECMREYAYRRPRNRPF